MRLAVTEHDAQSDAPIGKKHRLDPFRADIASQGRNNQIVLAAEHGKKAVLIERAEVARAPCSARIRSAEVALHDRGAFDDDLAFLDRNLQARQRAAYRAFFERSRSIERDDRAALGETVSLIDRNP